MPFVVKRTEDGKFGLYNKTKKEMSKKTFKTKEAAQKMGLHYDNFSSMRKKKSEPKEEVKEEEPKKKAKIVRKKKSEPTEETEEY